MNFDAMFFAGVMSDTMATLVGMTTVIFVTLIYFVEKVLK